MSNHHRAIAERMRWVLDSGRVESASFWATEAGLSRTFVTAFIERVRKGIVNDIGVNTLASLAVVARVSPAWLAFGHGSVDAGPENLKALTAKLPKGTYAEALVQQAVLVREVIGEPDLPGEIWQDYLDGLRKEARRVGLLLAAARLDSRGVKG